MREEGETIVVYTSNEDLSDDATPLSIVSSEAPPDLSLDSQIALYARVTWTQSDKTTWGVAGRVKNRACTIEASIEAQNFLANCRAIRVSDGTLMRKVAERVSDDQITYRVECEGYLGVVN